MPEYTTELRAEVDAAMAKLARVETGMGVRDPSKYMAGLTVADALTIRAHIDAQAERIAELTSAVAEARDQFAEYAELHAAKGTEDGDTKAAVNHAFACKMTRALAALKDTAQ